METSIRRIIDLVAPATQRLLGLTPDDVRELMLADELQEMAQVRGSYALVAREGERVCLARSLDRPLRYFLAKEVAGPMLVVAERIDEIASCLAENGYGAQFHPSYTRMVPAHHVTTLRLVGCPDPNPVYRRFFDPPMAVHPADLDLIGERYVSALRTELRDWLESQHEDEPIGVPFSGGIDSGAVLLGLYKALLDSGRSPSRLKAFTLSVEGKGEDAAQAREFLRWVGLEMLGEEVEVPATALAPERAIEVIEDYKALDVECATMNLAFLEALRSRYSEWRLLVDGDGGDENLKDYPIEENPELTIRSVVNNPMLYQEGWGVQSIKHSLTYSGGYSRSCVRTFAPARRLGFSTFSPYTSPAVIAEAEAIPFRDLASGHHERLYGLKGEIVRRGVSAVLGLDMPVFEKRRFQRGALADEAFGRLFDGGEVAYREHFSRLHAAE